MQIYGDFSGYTDMAIGTAHMLGYHLAKNFNMPYLSTNVVGVLASLAHLAIDLAARLPVHSAGRQPRRPLADLSQPAHHHDARRPVARGHWTFVVWGFLHGMLLIGHRQFRSFCEGRPLLRRALTVRPGNDRACTSYLPGGLSLLDILPRPLL